jgi:pimeloyl-ACP methyl ester carboxylesterase
MQVVCGIDGPSPAAPNLAAATRPASTGLSRHAVMRAPIARRCGFRIGACGAAVRWCIVGGETKAIDRCLETAPLIPAKCTIELETGIRMAYLEAGPPAGDAVVMLHGITDSSRAWSRSMARMHERRADLRLFALDQRGHGASSMPDPDRFREHPERGFGVGDFTADLFAFMDAKKLDRAVIVGHSMGSFIAQQAALTHPERVTKLVLVGSSDKCAGNPVARDYLLAETINGKWRSALESKGVKFPGGAYELSPRAADPDIDDWLARFWGFHPVADPAFVAAILAETAEVKIGTWLGATLGLLEVDNSERLRSLTVPTLAIWGTQDAIFAAEPDQSGLVAALAAAAKATGTPYHWKQYGAIPLPASGAPEDDIGHDTQWDAPDGVATDILSFIEAGAPTRDLYRSGGPTDPRRIVTEPGKARIIQGP